MGLSVTDLICDRGSRRVLSGLSFGVDAGEVLLLRGPNGAGKSTLLRALAGLLPVRGRIVLDGHALAETPDAYGERLTYAGHLDAIKPQLRVSENLAFWSALYAGAEPDAALAAFGLDPLADRPAQACSAGQKRRLGLARLLVAPRRLWLLDEPTVSLDAGAAARLEAAIRDHCAAGGTALIATHAALDLPGARTLDLAPAIPGRAGEADPFLAGRWA